MGQKWTNRDLPGALHFLTGSFLKRVPVFTEQACCEAFIETCTQLREKFPFKLIAYVLMPDHVHMIVNPPKGNIRDLASAIKSLSAKGFTNSTQKFNFTRRKPDSNGSINQVWQESFKALPLWSNWMVWQKINYIHANPVKAGLAPAAKDYKWSSFRAFYMDEPEPMAIDKDWWWPDDVRKLSIAAKEWSDEIEAKERDLKKERG